MESGALRLGAKFGKDQDRQWNQYHPLVCHMLDVAAVAGALWEHVLSKHVKGLLAQGLGVPEADAKPWVMFVAGLHDLGKGCRAWQKVDKHHAMRLQGTPLDATCNDKPPDHGLVTTTYVKRFLIESGLSDGLALRLATVAGGHHGYFPSDLKKGERGNIGEGDKERPQWDAARAELFATLCELVGTEGVPAGELSNPAALALAGLVTVADWIGSDERFFGFAMPDRDGELADLGKYFSWARCRAKEALQELHWIAAPAPDGELTLERILGKDVPDRPLQEEARRIANAEDVRLVIIEAPMGEGKTEAAIILADRWRQLGFRGAYFALPTQATANQLHKRVAGYLERRFPGMTVNNVLVHGGLAAADQPILPGHVDPGENEEEGTVAAGSYFLQSKRALLGDYGVGTIDQSLFAVLQVKHVFVRLFGLAGKPVVIDEVHAYDTYMSGLLERLLEWLGALQSPVVLLSATLPTGRRLALLNAYRLGQGQGQDPIVDDAVEAEYPRISWLAGDGAHAKGIDTSRESRRTLRIDQARGSDKEVRDELVRLLENGGCAAVICNTVGRAQEMYRVVRDGFAAEEVGLLHARFLAKDREKLEKKYVGMFGPPPHAQSKEPGDELAEKPKRPPGSCWWRPRSSSRASIWTLT